MIRGDIFERFAQGSPVTVTTQALLANALSPRTVDRLFEDVAERQDTRDRPFSDVVTLRGTVVGRIRPSIHAASQKHKEARGVTRKAVSPTIDRVGPGASAAAVPHTAEAWEPVSPARNGRREPWRSGEHTRIVEGRHLPGAEHRIPPRRATRAGALAGPARVVFAPDSGSVSDVIGCADGHAPERALTAEFRAPVRPRDSGIADRDFGPTALLVGIARRGGSFVIGPHGPTLSRQAVGERLAQGRCQTGAVFEPAVRAADETGETHLVRRITGEWDRPAPMATARSTS